MAVILQNSKRKRQDLYFFDLIYCAEYIIAYNRCLLIVSQSEFLFKIQLGVGTRGLGKCVRNHYKFSSLSFIYANEGWLGLPLLLNYSTVYFLIFNRLVSGRKR